MLGFTWKAALVLALTCLALAAWTLRDVLMALFGAFILANGMSLAAKTLAHKTGLRYALAAGIVIVACMATLGATFWFFGATLIEQVDELRQKIPDGAEWIRRQIEARSYMRDALSNLDVADLSGPTGWLARTLAPKVTSLLATAGSLVVMAIVAVYFAASPNDIGPACFCWRRQRVRDRATQLFEAIGAPAAFLAVPLTLLILTAVKVLYVEPARRELAAQDK